MTDYTLHRNCYISFIESNRQRLNKIVESKKHTQTQKNNKYTGKKTIMKFDSGREHVRRMMGIFLVLVGMQGNFEGTRNRVIDGCSRGGGRRLCKEDVGWIVDLKNFWQVGPCGLTWWAGQLGRWHLHMAYLVHNGK